MDDESNTDDNGKTPTAKIPQYQQSLIVYEKQYPKANDEPKPYNDDSQSGGGAPKTMEEQEKSYSIDLNETADPGESISEENYVQTITEVSVVTGKPMENDVNIIGRTFKSDDDAYEFYNAYARTVGFSMRKQSASKTKADKEVMGRIFCCLGEGEREKHPRGTPTKPRALTRTGCMARMQIRINDDETYSIVSFVTEHNHELSSQDKVHLLRSQRKIQPAQATLINNMVSAGFGATRIFSYMSEEAGGPQNLNFTQEDCNNLVQEKRIDYLKVGDAKVLLAYFKRNQKENKSFFYTIQVGDDDRIMNCFWCDAKS
ncbi:protein FAR1-RELATED SEQUENCE 5-like [Papaver somniferum]|uniref:protein FAR1-RELATED SEQUENCE 5-like n=1 Tax=Papaver somniferum TaxID=3469 RepID=UPI000E6F4DD0|nr:protein FAR1-RELATED SEQUENCE 5-like [Papaver somniferum]